MINKTENLKFLIQGDELAQACEYALRDTFDTFFDNPDAYIPSVHIKSIPDWLKNLYKNRDISIANVKNYFGVQFIKEALNIASWHEKRKGISNSKQRNQNALFYSNRKKTSFSTWYQTTHFTRILKSNEYPTVTKGPFFEKFATIFLYKVWEQKAVLMPYNFFALYPSWFKNHWSYFGTDNEMLKLLFKGRSQGYINNDGIRVKGKKSANTGSVAMSRSILTLPWFSFKDVTVKEIEETIVLLDKGKSSSQSDFGLSISNIFKVCDQILKISEGDAGFTRDDLNLLIEWVTYSHKSASNTWPVENEFSLKDVSFKNYVNSFREVMNLARKKQNNTRAAGYYRKDIALSRNKKPKRQELVVLANRILDKSLTKEERERALVEYITCSNTWSSNKKPQFTNFGKDSDAAFPGLEMLDFEKAKIFHHYYKQWELNWKKIGYEYKEGPVYALKHLFQYLFLYIPMWAYIYPEFAKKVDLPYKPKYLKRHLFIQRGSSEWDRIFPNTKKPLSLVELMDASKYIANSHNRVIRYTSSLLFFIESNHKGDVENVGEDFVDPVNYEMDKMRSPRGSRPSKSVKKMVPLKTIPLLHRYIETLETFGMVMQEFATNDPDKFKSIYTDFIESTSNQSFTYNPELFGFYPVIFYEGECIRLKTIPNLFNINERTYINPSQEITTSLIPHLTRLRLLWGMLSCGLRASHFMWLDIRDWDLGESTNSYFYELFVNTDKSHDAWETIVPHYIYRAFKSEQSFQNAIKEDVPYEINYQDRESSRFLPVAPLFRGEKENGKPIEKRDHVATFNTLMVHFSSLHFDIHGYIPDDFCVIEKNNATKETQDHTALYCSVNFKSKVTPHSLRKSYITHRAQLVEIEIIGRAVGQKGIAHTIYYCDPEIEVTLKKLEEADRNLLDDKMAGDIRQMLLSQKNNEASDEDNSFYEMFKNNPEKAVQQTNATTECLDVSGIKKDIGIKILIESKGNRLVSLPGCFCPFGEDCPEEVMPQIQEKGHCGLCPAAIKTRRHLKDIPAVIRAIADKVIELRDEIDVLKKDPKYRSHVELLSSKLRINILEMTSWKLIWSNLEANTEEDNITYIADDMGLVSKKLKKFEACTEAQNILLRLAEANSYPTLQTKTVRAIAERFRRKILANRGLLDAALSDIPDVDKVQTTSNMILTLLDANQLTLNELNEISKEPAIAPKVTLLNLPSTKKDVG